MENQSTEDPNSIFPQPPKAEEFPIEEFEGVPDWNAAAWEKIKARDAKRAALAEYLSKLPMSSLDASHAVLNRDKQDVELRDAIAREIERRVDEADAGAIQ